MTESMETYWRLEFQKADQKWKELDGLLTTTKDDAYAQAMRASALEAALSSVLHQLPQDCLDLMREWQGKTGDQGEYLKAKHDGISESYWRVRRAFNIPDTDPILYPEGDD